MIRKLAVLLIAIVSVTIAGFTLADEAVKDGREVDVPRAKLPDKVAKAATDAVPGGKIADIDHEVRGGKSRWEVGVDVAGKTIQVVVDDDGKVLSKAEIRTETLKIGEVPAAVAEGVRKEFPGGRITNAQKLTKGAEVSYEMDVDVQKKTYEVVFSPEGKLLSKAEAKEVEEEKAKK